MIPQWKEATEALHHADTVLIVAHVSPDGDAIGSLLALRNSIIKMGKTVTVAVDDGVPSDLKFMPCADKVLPKLKSGKWDLMIATDCGDEIRTGEVGKYGMSASDVVLNLDHHPTNPMFGDVQLVMPNTVSATEIVFHWLEYMHMAESIEEDVAVPLLTGLMTDTLGFRTSNVTAGTLYIAQKLVEAGASISEISARALDSMSYSTLKVWKEVFPSIELDEAGLISATITLQDAVKAGIQDVTDGGLVSLLNQVTESTVAVVFKEKAPQQITISLRCKLGFDVGTVAAGLGGGGHKQASGATLNMDLASAKAKVIPLLHEAIQRGAREIV